MESRMDDIRHFFQTGIQHFSDPYCTCNDSQGSSLRVADMKDDAGNDYRNGSDGVDAGIVFLSDKSQDAVDRIPKAGYPAAEGEFFRVHHGLPIELTGGVWGLR